MEPGDFNATPRIVRDTSRQAEAAQRRIETDTYARLGIATPHEPRPATIPSEQQVNDLLAHRERVAFNPHRALEIPLGSQVNLGPSFGEGSFFVVGGAGDDVKLARRAVDGTLERVTTPLRDVLAYTPRLTASGFRDAVGERWVPFAGGELIPAFGRDTPLLVIPASAFEPDAAGNVPELLSDDPRAASGTWGDVLDQSRNAARSVQPVAPTADTLGNLRTLLGDRTMVTDELGLVQPGGRDLLVATESMPGSSADILADAAATNRWFNERTGNTMFGAREGWTVLRSNSPDGVANASAGLASDGTVVIMEGPRSAPIRGAWNQWGTGIGSRQGLWVSKLVHSPKNDVTVRTHEGGHVAMFREWSDSSRKVGVTAAQDLEEGVVQEAMADLFGTARSGRRSLGFRDAGRLERLSSNLGVLREYHTTPEADPHMGTQLLTYPMRIVTDRHGDDFVAEVGGAAVRDIATQLAETQDTVTIPQTAEALRDAVAHRLGPDHETVQQLNATWAKLGVPIAPLEILRGLPSAKAPRVATAVHDAAGATSLLVRMH